ncbi:MAG: pilin [Pseudomonadota bacterium]
MRRTLALAAALAAVALCGCNTSTESEGGSALTGPPERRALTDVPHVAWLSRELPPETIGYFRVPLLWDGLSQPGGDAMNNVKASAAHQAQLAKIRQGLTDNIWSQLPPVAAAPLKLLFDAIDSPLEVAATLPPDGSLVPNFLIGASLRLSGDQTFPELLEDLLSLHPQLRRLSPEDEQGVSTILAGPLPVYVHYAADNKRLRMFTGASATAQYFRERLAAEPTDNPVHAWEQPRDQSGRGLSMWVDIARLWPQVSPMVPAEERQRLDALGISAMEALHLASVARDGHGQLLLELKMPEVGFRRLLPRPSAAVGLKSAGPPDLMVRIALPTAEDLAAGMALFRSQLPDPTEFDDAMAQVNEGLLLILGADPSLLLQALGPQYVYMSDQSGVWGGYQVRDQGAMDELLEALQTSSGNRIERRTTGGETVSYLKLPTSFPFDEELAAEDVPPPVKLALEVTDRISAHLFWQDEDDYMVAASVPQVLMSRSSLGAAYDVDRWLTESVGVDPEKSVLLLAKRNAYGARDAYHFYLELLMVLADLANVSIDPFELPTWQDAGPGDPGGIALGLDSSPESLALHLTYQASPLEVLGGGNAMVVAAGLGIVSAVAVPAYQDYQVRAQVSAAMLSVGSQQMAVEMHYLEEGRFPDSLDDEPRLAGAEVDYNAETGALIIEFGEGAPGPLAFGSLEFLPSVDADGMVTWSCFSATLPDKVLPASCRE